MISIFFFFVHGLMTPRKFSESLSQSFAIILYFSPSISLQKEITVILKHHADY